MIVNCVCVCECMIGRSTLRRIARVIKCEVVWWEYSVCLIIPFWDFVLPNYVFTWILNCATKDLSRSFEVYSFYFICITHFCLNTNVMFVRSRRTTTTFYT